MLAEEPPRAKTVVGLGFEMENVMSDSGGKGTDSNALLYVLGALVVVVAILAIVMLSSHGDFGHFWWHRH
jgi:hypothetical protein